MLYSMLRNMATYVRIHKTQVLTHVKKHVFFSACGYTLFEQTKMTPELYQTPKTKCVFFCFPDR